ncbi:MAG: PLP-dependent aminotransferase family protein [Calditrichota bacterium]
MAKLQKEIIIAGIELDTGKKAPLYRQVYQQFRKAILDGRFTPGQQLPPSRDLAKYLNISRTTVTMAFEHLMLEGYIRGKQGAGTFINEDIPERLLFANRETLSERRHHPDIMERKVPGKNLAAVLERERDDYNAFAPFKPGVPDLSKFPFRKWGKLLSISANTLSVERFGYGSSAGYKPLRKAIANYLRIARGVKCGAQQVIITSGSQQGISLICRVLLEKGSTVGFEDPGYVDAQNIFRSNNIHTLPIPLDEEGINFKNIPEKPELIYVTPSHHYPLGITMSLNRRLELLDYANSIGSWILEDDYDSEYRYNGLPLSALQGLDNSASVIYMGTFSKVMFPGIRLGYLVVPEALIDPFIAARLLADRHSPFFEQSAMEMFLSEGHYGRHVRKMRLLYQKRRDTFYSLVENHLNDYLDLHPTEAGLHTVAWLKQHKNDKLFAEQMLKSGIYTPALSGYTIKYEQKPGLVLGYAAYSGGKIERTILKMKQVLRAGKRVTGEQI